MSPNINHVLHIYAVREAKFSFLYGKLSSWCDCLDKGCIELVLNYAVRPG